MPSTAVAKAPAAAVTKFVTPEIQITTEDIRKHYAPTSTDKEFAILCDQIRANKLDPRKKEVYFVKYGQNPAQIITGYLVYVARAVSTKQLDGWKVWVEGKGDDAVAKIEINRKDWAAPFVWEVPYAEFHKDQSTHKSMPTFMLKKIAIGQGFRLAFPEVLASMPYLAEEVQSFTDENTSKEIDKIENVTPRVVIGVAKAAPATATEAAPVVKRGPGRPPKVKVEEPAPEEPTPEEAAEAEAFAEDTTGEETPEETAEETPAEETDGFSEAAEATEEPAVEEEAEPEVALLPQEKKNQILIAFGKYKISQKLIESVLGAPIARWNENHKSWLTDRYHDCVNGVLDSKKFAALNYNA
jgi:hypothetical protein